MPQSKAVTFICVCDGCVEGVFTFRVEGGKEVVVIISLGLHDQFDEGTYLKENK